jgi:hypothetical protein
MIIIYFPGGYNMKIFLEGQFKNGSREDGGGP